VRLFYFYVLLSAFILFLLFKCVCAGVDVVLVMFSDWENLEDLEVVLRFSSAWLTGLKGKVGMGG
jgi:hypothetical protein